MNRTLPLLFFITFLFFSIIAAAQTVPDGNGIVYVKKGSSGNGSSWANARGELADALVDAKTNTTIRQIWVAYGNYLPLYRADDLAFGTTNSQYYTFMAFLMVKDVKLYGGFQGTETSIDQRNIAGYPTTLDGNQYDPTKRFDNCMHVVVAAGDVGTAELNGFYIQEGHARSALSPTYNGHTTPGTIGGGMLIWESSPKVENCVFWGNVANWGGGIYLQNSNTTLINCTFVGNQAEAHGGGLYIYGPYAGQGVINCTIACNSAAGHSGYYFNDVPSIPIRNSIIWNNIIYGSNVAGNGSNIKNSLVQGSGPDPANNNIGDVDPKLTGWRPPEEAPFVGGDYRVAVSTSPVIDKGDNSFYPGLDANTRDGRGQPRLRMINGKGSIDIGANEYYGVPVHPDPNGIVYVKKGGTGNGSSWNDALDEAAHPFVAAIETFSIKEVWIAKGTYYPLYRDGNLSGAQPKDRSNTFWIRNNIKVYGGFAGNEQSIAERSFKTNDHETILSGDYNNDDITIYQSEMPVISNTGENVLNVVKIQSGAISAVTIDGVTITGATESAIQASSLNSNTSLQLNHLTIRNNKTTSSPVKIVQGNIMVKNSRFHLNHALSRGGGISSSYGQLTVLNSVFTNNFSQEKGAALHHFNNNCKIVNCTMVSNFTSNTVSSAIFSDNSISTSYQLDIQNSMILSSFPPTGSSTTLIRTTNNTVANESILQFVSNPTFPIGGNWQEPGVDMLFDNMIPQPIGAAYNTGNMQAYLDAGGSTSDLDMAGNPRVFGASIDIGAFEFNRMNQTITVSDLSKTYGDAAFEPSSTTTSGMPLQFVSSNTGVAEIFQDAADGNKTKIRINKAGNTTITVSQAGDISYYPATDQTFLLTVNPKTLTIEASPAQITYGDAEPVLNYTSNGLIGSDAITGALSRTAGNNVGAYPILTGSLDAGPDYQIDFITADLIIVPKSLTITGNAQSKIYGETDPSLSYSSNGLVGNDNLTGEPARVPGEDAGVYTINQGSLSAGNNYTINFTPASLTITPKDLFLEAGSYQRPYGEANPVLTIQYNGFITGEGAADITPPAIATTALPGSVPGDYPVTLSGGSATNYVLKPNNGMLTVTGAVVNLQQEPQDLALCAGNAGSFSVTADAPSPMVNLQYQWEKSENGNNWQTINGAMSSTLSSVNTIGYYRCRITAPGTTIISDAARFSINTALKPTILIDDKICIDNTLLNLNATPAGGQFSGTGISNNVWNLEIPATGKQTIQYQYTDNNGCIGTASKEVILETCGNFGSIISVKAWPNPTRGPISLKLLIGIADNWYINVSNLEGKSLLQKKFQFRKGWNTAELNIAHLPSGTYLITLGRGGSWKHSIQVIKK